MDYLGNTPTGLKQKSGISVDGKNRHLNKDTVGDTRKKLQMVAETEIGKFFFYVLRILMKVHVYLGLHVYVYAVVYIYAGV